MALPPRVRLRAALCAVHVRTRTITSELPRGGAEGTLSSLRDRASSTFDPRAQLLVLAAVMSEQLWRGSRPSDNIERLGVVTDLVFLLFSPVRVTARRIAPTAGIHLNSDLVIYQHDVWGRR